MVWGMWVREVILAVPTCVGRKKRGRAGRRGAYTVVGGCAAGGVVRVQMVWGRGRLWGAVPLDNSHVGKVDSSLILNQLGFISL